MYTGCIENEKSERSMKDKELKELKDAIEYEEDAETKALLEEEYYGMLAEEEINIIKFHAEKI